jgi:DNA-binding NarL/FixJ family response regulator
VPTIKAHVSAVLDKLDATNRVQVALLIHDADTDRTRRSGSEQE